MFKISWALINKEFIYNRRMFGNGGIVHCEFNRKSQLNAIFKKNNKITFKDDITNFRYRHIRLNGQYNIVRCCTEFNACFNSEAKLV